MISSENNYQELEKIVLAIRRYAEWIDKDSIEELRLYLDEIRELAVDAIDILDKKAEPIRLGLVLEGKDAHEFEEHMKNPKVTKEQMEFFKKAIEVYKSHPF